MLIGFRFQAEVGMGSMVQVARNSVFYKEPRVGQEQPVAYHVKSIYINYMRYDKT